MNPTSPIDRSRLSINRTSVGQRLLSSWFRTPALWSLIFLCTATALVLVVHAANTENDHLEPGKTAGLLVDAAGRDGHDVMITLGNTISGTVFDANGNPITTGRTIKLVQNGTLSGTTATSDGSGIYTFNGLTLANGDKITVYISGATERGATFTFTGTSDINTLNIYQNQLVVRSDNGNPVTNADLKSGQGTPDVSLHSVADIDPSNILTTPVGFGLQIWTGTTYAAGADINDGGNWINNGTFTAGSNIVTFNGANNQTITGLNSTTFNNLVIANTGTSPNNVVSLDGSAGATSTVVTTLTITNGVFDQGIDSASSDLLTSGIGQCVVVRPGKTWRNRGRGDETLSCNVLNEGTIEFNAVHKDCGDTDEILIRSSIPGLQRTWEGTGTFSMTDVDVRDQKVPGGSTLPLQILVSSGTNSLNNTGWIFNSTCAGPYTWIGGSGQRWADEVNWSPLRSDANNASTTDVLIFDGSVTPATVVEDVQSQTNSAIRLQNGVDLTLHANVGGATLVLNGATGNDLDVPANTLLTLAGAQKLIIELTAPTIGGTVPAGHVAGQLIMKDDKHQLSGDNAGEIIFTGANALRIDSTYSATTHPFGEGTSGSVIFQSGATGVFSSGLDPLGGAGKSVVTFNAGSTAHFFATTALLGDAGTYGNLILDGAQDYLIAGSSPITILNNLEIDLGSTFLLSSSPGADLNLYGNFIDKTTISRGFSPNTRVVKFLGATQTVSKAGGGIAGFDDVLINQSPGGKVQLLSPTDIGLLNLGTANALLELNGQVLELVGTVTGPGNLKGDPNAILAASGNGDVGTVNFVSGGRNLSGLILNRGTNGSMTLGTSLDLAGTLRLDNGILNTGVNTLSLSPTSPVVRNNGYVNGNLQKSFGATGNLGSFIFPLGTANAYSPLDANVTANTNGTLTAKAVQGKQPNISGANALQRYWSLNGSGITANLTFHYRGGAPTTGDVVGSEGNYKFFKYDGSFTQFTPDATGSNSATDHFATLNNVSSFSDWTLAEPLVIVVGNDDSYSTNEDTPLHVDAPGVLTNDTGVTLTASLNTGPAHASSFQLNLDGSFDYTPAANYNGQDSFIYTAHDAQGGTANATVTITINPVNDAPTFQIPSNPPAVNEDAGAQTVNNFATNFQPGPPTATDEAGQTLVGYTLTPSGSTGGLTFTSGPAISNAGTLTYTAAANANGTATFNVVATDSGSGSPPNVNQSAPRSFTITVHLQNENPTLATNAGLSVANGATGTIDSTRLKVDDADNTAAQLTYTIGTAPANGTLKNGPIALSGGATFTQGDINSNQITYQHNGSATIADSFSFTVSDGAGGSIGSTTFNITIACTTNITVTSNADSGNGTLRQAIAGICAGGTITFDTAGTFATPQTITLSNQITIGIDNVTIDGPDPLGQRVTIAGGGTTRLFRTQALKTATIRDLTLTGGAAPIVDNYGGAIYNDHATLALIGVTVSGSSAAYGGGIYNDGLNGPSSNLTIINSTISGNTVNGNGGGIYNIGTGGSATLNLTNSTVSGNNANGQAGGIYSDGTSPNTPVTITNCTITNNRADNNTQSSGTGGGLFVFGGTTLTLRNSIVDLNFVGGSPGTTASDIVGAVVAGGASTHNLMGNCTSCGLTDGVDNNSLNVPAASLNIGALAANGAINQTHALLPGSIAIDGGNDAYIVSPPFLNVSPITDERGTGFLRLAGPHVDIGAFETPFIPHHPPSSADNARTIAEDTNYTFVLADFAFSDPNDTPADTFTNVKVTSLAAAGTLFFDADGAGGNPPVAVTLNQLIPVADISAGHLFFTPAANANGTPYAMFQFAVQDNGGAGSDTSGNYTFTINVTAQNDNPTLTINANLSVANGGTGTIGITQLLVGDIDNTAAQLVYTIGTAPANGTLKKGVTVLSSGNTFTQADINGNQISYQHNGSATLTDSFTFTVSDGAGGSISSTTFDINIGCGNNFTVTSNADSGNGSLRQAIAAICAGGAITFDTTGAFATPQTITLSSQLTIGTYSGTENVTIDGPDPAAQRVTIAGGGSSRLFRTQPGKTATIRDLTLIGGSAAGDFGGAIDNDHATLSLIGVTVSGNTADFGGAIYNNGGPPNGDGAVTLTIVNSTITGNTASVGSGGAIYNTSSGGNQNGATVNLTNSTLSGNNATTIGGGVFSDGVSGITPVNITNCTITNNRVGDTGGGLLVTGGTTVTLRNSIVDLNFQGNTTNASDISGPVVAGGASTHNLIGSCSLCGLPDGVNNNQLNVSAASLNIGALAANGAIVQTHALLPGSIAINAGNDAYVVAPPFLNVSPITDERGTGFARLVGTQADIGAFEAGHAAPTSANNARTFAEDNNYTFALEDFAFSDLDNPADTFTNVKITSLATAGTLFFDSDGAGGNPPVAVTLNQLIPVADITAGHLFFTPGVNANGVPYATFQFAVQDSGTTGNGGSELSTNYTFTMNVTAVNDAPTFQIAGDPPTVNEDAGLQTVSGFATNFLPGPPTATDEAGQTLSGYTLSPTVSTGGLTFSSGPAIDNNGTLTYTTTGNTSGTATFNVVAIDSGSGTAPNVNQSAPLSFTITVNSQNDAPTLTTNAGVSVANGGTATVDNTRLLVSDIDNPADQLTYTIGTAPVNGTLRKNGVALTGSGTFTQDDINNNLITYQHNGSATLTDSFTFTVSDGAGGSIGLTTFNITVTCGNNLIVTSNADSGSGTLRQAIAGICDGGTITFDMNQVVSPITLASALSINKSLTIQGPGANLLTITGADTFGLITASTSGINVNIDGLSFTHGGPDAGFAVAIEFDNGGTLTVSNCEFSANSGAGKAVIYTSLSTGLIVRASTFGNNTTLNAILSDQTPLTVVNSTISDNSGTAINNSAVGSTVTNSTIANNGSGIQSNGGPCGGCAASVTVTNSLLSSNGSQNILATGGGTVTSGGHNLIDDLTSSAFTNPSDPTNIIVSPGTAGIAALAYNGGLTRTRALMSGSAALDAGDNTAATNAGLMTDQRGAGFNRIADGPDVDTIDTVDIGAFEAQLAATNATTDEDTKTTSGLVISRDDAEGVGVTNFKITGVTNGTLFKNNGTDQINSGDFITVAEGNAGLKFMPAANLFSPGTTFSFQAQASLSNSDGGLVGGVAPATITVNPIADTPSVTNATTTINAQTTSGLVISRNAVDGNEVTNFQITNITNGTLFKNDGTTHINNNDFITFTEGNAGLKFTPALNSTSNGSFDVQGATSNSGAGLSSAATATITVACGPTVVTNSNDSGPGSLRSIINAACAGATITFDMTPGNVTSPIMLTSGQLTINKILTIAGPGANSLAISGDNTFRLMNVTGSGVNLTINNLSFTGGGGNQFASAIQFSDAGTLTINDSEFYGNANSIGGTVYLNQSVGLTVKGSSFHNNTTPFGIGINLTPSNVLNSTISNNSGYGIGNFSSNLSLTNSTIADNGGNGIGNNSQAGPVSTTLSNVLLSNNGGNDLDKTGANSNTFSSNGRNVIDDNTFSLLAAPGPGDLLGLLVPARLAPLANNGGTTQTRALLAGSAALDAGDNTLATNAGLTADQRGAPFGRAVDGPDADMTDTVDIGAFEAQVSVEDIPDKSTNEDTQLQFTFNVGGVANITSVTATSSDTTLVPNNAANIAVSGSGSTRTLTINPVANLAGTSTITVTVNGNNGQSMIDTFVLTVSAIADTPSVTNATTNEDTQTASGLVISPDAADVEEVTNFKITNITNGTLFKNNGTTVIASNSFITVAEGNAGLKFTPAANRFSPATTFSFQAQASVSNSDAGLGGGLATATITVNPIADTPLVTNAATTINTQTSSGLVISRNAADSTEVTNFKITNITGGALFRNDGTTQITNDSFITFGEGNAGLKFTPSLNSNANGSFQIQASVSGDNGGVGGGLATATISVGCGSTLVINSNDSGAGSLRDTILHACNGATITFDMTPGQVTSPITLTSGELLMNKNLVIQGPNADVLTVQRSAAAGTPSFNIFNNPAELSLGLSGLTLSNADNPNNGGAIKNAGALNLNSMALTNNHTAAGGSALFNTQTGTATVANTTFSNNHADQFAAIYNQGGSLSLTNSTLTGNANQSNFPGAAIFSESFAGVTNITNCTIAQNTGQTEVVWRNPGGPALINLKNTIVSGNTGGDVSGTTDLGNNLIGSNARLAALGNYGGPTQTMALLPGSPAINAGTATGAPTTDQRGISRVGAVDIGAFESRGFTISAASGTPQSATILSAFGSPLVASIGGVGGEPVNGGVLTFTAPASGASAVLTGGGATATASIASGQASISATANGVGGPYNVTASAIGATSASFSLTNNKAATTTAVTSSLNPSDVNQNVTFTAKVTGAVTPTGTVQFKDNGANLGSPVALNGSGVAQLTTSTLTAGNHTITADYSGDGNLLPSTGTLSGGQTVGFRPLIKFSQATYSVNENGNVISITVVRQGDTSPAVTVDYATPDDSAAMSVLPCSNANGVASPRCDFTTALGTLRFAAGETSKTFNVLISQDLWVEGNETAQLTLSNPTGGAAFQQPSDALAVLTIVDDDTTPPTTNAIDDSTTFVRQQYHDFLNREPDTTGLNFWVNQIESCGADTQCRAVKRINVSAAFFLSIEFQNTGYFVERMYKAGFGDIAPPTVPVPVRFTNFLTDSQEIRGNIIVGQGNWQQQIDDAKRAFALAFVQRPAFLNRYPAITSAEAFVDSLNTNAGMVLLDSERSALISELSPSPADTALRADVLQKVAENAVLQQQEFNRAFVLMQYFGYLRRNPDAAPEATLNFAGYNFWLSKLNQANGDYVGAELIKAFITSGEYRGRFGP